MEKCWKNLAVTGKNLGYPSGVEGSGPHVSQGLSDRAVTVLLHAPSEAQLAPGSWFYYSHFVQVSNTNGF